jgi:phosphatidate cytidylyltransferase
MADNSRKLLIRVISAVLAGSAVLSIGIFGGQRGLILVCLFAIMMSVREYSRMLFQAPKKFPALMGFFILLSAILVAALALTNWDRANVFAIAITTLITGGIWLTRNRITNEDLLPLLGMMVLGTIFCVFLPTFAILTVQLPHGGAWFLFLLVVVFFGDTFAYFGGRFFGNHKLMPQLSPNKTMEGGVAGLIGSCLAGCAIVAYNFPSVSLLNTILFCLVCGFIAQAGDLFMSLVKRVAKVKDFGQIMPGHGGILDRLDGLFIACPLVYAFALFSQP